MNTQNVNVKTATPESPKTWAENQSSTALTGNISRDDFFAPSTAGLLDNLLAQYKFMRARLYSISNVISDIESQKGISYFLRGNYNSSRGYHVPPVCKLFDISGALAALNAEYWQSALDLTDVNRPGNPGD